MNLNLNFEDWWEFDGLGEEFWCQIGWSDRKKNWTLKVLIDWGGEAGHWLRWFFWGIEVKEELLVKLRDQEVIDDGGWSDIRQGRLFGVWGFWRWWSLGFLGLRKKRKQRKKMKLILSTIHLTQVAFLEGITGEDDLSHHVQQMRGMEVVKWWGWRLVEVF